MKPLTAPDITTVASRRRPSRRRRAFTLLEIMSAVLIIGFAVVALLQVQASVMRRTMSVRDRARALMAAETALDAFLVQPDFGDLSRSDYIDEQAEVTLQGYDDFLITRFIQDRSPLDRQETVEVNPTLADDILNRRLEAINQVLDAAGAQPGGSGGTGGTGRGGQSTVRGQAAPTSSGDAAFDPGAFVAVRVEVRQRDNDRLLTTLEMWLPRPPRPEEEVAR